MVGLGLGLELGAAAPGSSNVVDSTSMRRLSKA